MDSGPQGPFLTALLVNSLLLLGIFAVQHSVMARHVRHPLYVGWFITFWATPTMTGAHLLFAIATSAYILITIQFEEKDLVRFHGSHFKKYNRAVPMIVPTLRPRHQSQVEGAAGSKTDG